MMAVIFLFCLHLPAVAGPPALANSQGRAHKHAAIWQLGSYIWVLPPKNPQGLAQLYVRSPFIGKEKSTGFVEFRKDCGKFQLPHRPVSPCPTLPRAKTPAPRNPPSDLAARFPAPSPPVLRVPAKSNTHR